MFKLSYRYDQTSARLLVEGLPDLSAGQENDVIGIISGWRLEFVGAPQFKVKGQREHLEALLACVLPYARYCLSGIRATFGDKSSPVRIYPDGKRHHLELFCNRSDDKTALSTVVLDDAELADLVHCLDSLRLDPRILITWSLSPDIPLRRHELDEKVPVLHRLAAPLVGIAALVVVAGVALLPPIPSILPESQSNIVAEITGNAR